MAGIKCEKVETEVVWKNLETLRRLGEVSFTGRAARMPHELFWMGGAVEKEGEGVEEQL